ncbi:MAG: MFS transporter [Dehalococcoidia bacterium]|uniref:MFS transporter n=1 Tax=Candidatus Amarobacter glycogenicus TaxID=3140699 RepID=UPI001DB888F5|nr:MFS transporter [Dehalococcoidia bacterium]MBK6562723.1 MFS transporter [Dehalococcoidia bacterium]MBK7725527.1 MFS transporter [Dehalococcoidia bacterium]MBK8560894.1 MFS transporter [Dehalococcoidia bacterium]MBK9610011.1 MFS transporter [Dehalococcoidia bacterium]
MAVPPALETPESDGDATSGGPEDLQRQSWTRRTFGAVIENPHFRNLFIGNIFQFGSMQMQLVVRSWLVFHITGSFAALGTVALANAIPGLLLSPVGGLIADRAPKKTIIQSAQIYNMANAAVLAALAAGWLGVELAFWHLFLSSFLQGGVNSIMMPSRQSMISDLVPRDRLMNVIGINSSGQTFMQLVGPGIAGFLIAALSPAAVFGVMAALYFFAVTFTMRLPTKPLYAFAQSDAGRAAKLARSGGRRSNGFKDLKDGMRYVATDPTIRMLIMVNFLIVVVAMPYTMLLAGFVKDILHKGAFEQGILQSVQGLGAVGGSIFIASSASKGRGKMMIGWGALLGVGIVAFSISTSFWITLPIMIFIGAAQAGRMAIGQVLVQSYSEEEYRGRVQSVWFMQFSLVQFGTFLVSILAEFAGPQVAIGGLAALLVLAMGLIALFVPAMRRLD